MTGSDGFIQRVREWTRAHVITTAILAGVFGLIVGIGSSSTAMERADKLKADLRALQTDLRDDADRFETDRALLQEENQQLTEEMSQLETESARLEQQVLELKAHRRLPNVVGEKIGYVDQQADRYGWNLRTKHRYSTSRSGTVVSQTPSQGTMMRLDASFTVVVAKAIPKVPNLIGDNRREVNAAASEVGWNVSFLEQVSSAKPGTVIAVSPGAGSRLLPGATLTVTIAKKAPLPPPPPPSDSGEDSGGSGCTPGYSPCLPPASDYDCAGGTGDGPEYVSGPVTVTGSDPYGLDSDNDGLGCES